jgi:hypothetical protein
MRQKTGTLMRSLLAAGSMALLLASSAHAAVAGKQPLFNDSHFHLTNYIQEGTHIQDLLGIMGDKVGRVALFGIPLQQQWSERVTGDIAPTYYLDTDAHLYYYSFTDAYIATVYNSLSKKDKARFDPMITGFNPTDMYAADHIRRVLQTFPGVFSGIGEFTIHKEFVSSKITGDVASLTDKALGRLLDFSGEAGLLVIMHNDIAMPFPKEGKSKIYVDQATELLKRHPKTTIIWAHTGLGRVIQPLQGHAQIVESILADPQMAHVNFDISWDQVAKYLVATPQATQATADLMNKYPDRFLFGTDEVAPTSWDSYSRVYYQYQPLWALLKPETREKVLRGNYERLFDAAAAKVRAWEKANPMPGPVMGAKQQP